MTENNISLETCLPTPLTDCPPFIQDFIETGREVESSFTLPPNKIVDEVSWRLRRLLTFHMLTGMPFFLMSMSDVGGVILGYQIEDGSEKIMQVPLPPAPTHLLDNLYSMIVKDHNGIRDEGLDQIMTGLASPDLPFQ